MAADKPQIKFEEMDVHESIRSIHYFDEDHLGYIDFCTALV